MTCPRAHCGCQGWDLKPGVPDPKVSVPPQTSHCLSTGRWPVLLSTCPVLLCTVSMAAPMLSSWHLGSWEMRTALPSSWSPPRTSSTAWHIVGAQWMSLNWINSSKSAQGLIQVALKRLFQKIWKKKIEFSQFGIVTFLRFSVNIYMALELYRSFQIQDRRFTKMRKGKPLSLGESLNYDNLPGEGTNYLIAELKEKCLWKQSVKDKKWHKYNRQWEGGA